MRGRRQPVEKLAFVCRRGYAKKTSRQCSVVNNTNRSDEFIHSISLTACWCLQAKADIDGSVRHIAITDD